MNSSELTGIILAGGKSSRMGREKGLLLFRDKPLVTCAIRLLENFTARILISTAKEEYSLFGHELVPDRVPGLGPAAGLAATLRRSATDWNLVVACDQPFLEPGLFSAMLEARDGFEAVVPVHDGKPEPLVAIYHRSLSSAFEEAVQSGNLALHRVLKDRRVCWFDCEGWLESYPQLFTNFNTAEDMKRSGDLNEGERSGLLK